jgi:hypothetical protein
MMARPDTTTPAPAGSGNRRQNVGIDRLDISVPSPHDSISQRFGPLTGAALAARLIAARYGITPHLAELEALLAGAGGRP